MRLLLLIVTALFLGETGWGQWTEPVPMEPQFGVGVRVPWISNDGLRLYLTGGLGVIAVTERDSINGAWGPVETLPSHINYTGTKSSMCESPSGDTLYFISDSDQRPGEGYGWLDVYYCVQTDTGWGPAINCGDSVNGPGQEWSVGIRRDGSRLLISSPGSQGEGGGAHLLWYSNKRPDGTWGSLISFGDSINPGFPYAYENPSLSPDNTRLFFYWQHSYSADLMESRLVSEVWQMATPLPSPVNDLQAEDMNPCIANDGRTLWFRSERTGQSQIYTSVDTTVLSAFPRRPQSSRSSDRMGGLYIHEESEGQLSITISFSVMPLTNLVTLYDLLGRTIKKESTPFLYSDGESTAFMSVAGLPVGFYIISVQLRDQLLSHKYILLH